MIRIAIAAAALTLGMASAAQALTPGAPPPTVPAATQAQKVVEVHVGGGYYRHRHHLRYPYYRWHRPWYGYGSPAYFYEPPVVVVTQPPPQPVWTGAGVIWMFPGGAPQ